MAKNFSVSFILNLQDKLTAPLRGMSKTLNSFSANLNKMNRGMGGAARATTSLTGGVFKGLIGFNLFSQGLGLIKTGFSKVISEASNFENSIASFTTLLGGSEKAAEELVGTLQRIGAQTPFEFKDLAATTQQLLGFGVVSKDTVEPTLRMLGDLAQGNAEKLKGISLVYGQVMAGGKMMGQDFNQLINQGVPIAQGLAKVWKVDVNEAIKRVKQNGPVAAKDVQEAMKLMTSEGGLFYQGMLRSSKTLTGLLSTLQDSLNMTAAGIGTALLPKLKEFAIYVTEAANLVLAWVQENKELINNIISGVVKALGMLFSILKVTFTVVYKLRYGIIILAAAFLGYMGVVKSIALALKLAAAAQWLLNIAMTANPIGLIVAGVAALAAGVYLIYKNWDTVVAAFKKGAELIMGYLEPVRKFIWEKMIPALTFGKFGGGKVGDLAASVFGEDGKNVIKNESKTSVDINVYGKDGATATIGDVKKKGPIQFGAKTNNGYTNTIMEGIF